MLAASGGASGEVCLIARLVDGDAAGLGVAEEARVGQVVQLGVVDNVPDAAVEGLAQRGEGPLVVDGLEGFGCHPSDLEGGVDVQELVEGRHPPAALARRVVELCCRPICKNYNSIFENEVFCLLIPHPITEHNVSVTRFKISQQVNVLLRHIIGKEICQKQLPRRVFR